MQRLPLIVGTQTAYTGREITGREAATLGLIQACTSTRDQMMEHVMTVAQTIASKSPLAMRLNYLNSSIDFIII
jgi:enoyl-CoA hydratase/carnithine racemase